MRKILNLFMIILVTLTTSSMVFAGAEGKRSTKAIMPFKGKFETTLEKEIQSIAPIGSSVTNDQLKLKINNMKKIIDTNNALSKQINRKDKNALKLIQRWKRKKQMLTADQYLITNNLLTQINIEKKDMQQNEISNLLEINDKLNIKTFRKLTTKEITNIENILNQNTTCLNKISTYYDGIIEILNTAATTTPSAITTRAAVTY